MNDSDFQELLAGVKEAGRIKRGEEKPARRNADVARARENGVFVIRADVAGRTESLVSYGSSEIVNPDGRVLQAARQLSPDLIVAEIETSR